MNLRRVAWSNVWRNRGRYVALGSAAFAVMVYFLFSAVVLHPDFQGGYRGARIAAQAMQGGAVVVASFTFFLLFANSAFIRFRRQEFGLLRLMGVTRGQLVRLLLWEGLITALAALAIGSGLGLLFVQLFFLGISALLQLPEPIPFYAGPGVWLSTAAAFSAIFLVISLHSIRGVLRNSIVGLLRARRRTKESPTYARWKVAVGIILLGLGYAWAALGDRQHMVLAAVPVTLMVSIGAYLLTHEGSIALLTRLRRDERRFYRPVPFLNQLLFKLKDNARTLTSVALLVAVILTAMGTIYSIYAVLPDDVRATYVHFLEVTRMGGEAADLAGDAQRFSSILQEQGLEIQHQWHLITTWAELALPDLNMSLILVPYSFYRDMRHANGEKALPAPDPGDAVLVVSGPLEIRDGHPYHVTVGDQRLAGIARVDSGRPLFFQVAWALVLADETFSNIMAGAPEDGHIALAAWTTSPEIGRVALEAHNRVWEQLDFSSGNDGFVSMAERYEWQVSRWAIVLFMSVFTSLVFFAACCSLLYFRLYTEIDDERRYYRRLADLGGTKPPAPGQPPPAADGVFCPLRHRVGPFHLCHAGPRHRHQPKRSPIRLAGGRGVLGYLRLVFLRDPRVLLAVPAGNCTITLAPPCMVQSRSHSRRLPIIPREIVVADVVVPYEDT